MIIWASDSAAYFAGRALGKHPFAPHLSPKKTWEGSIAGFASSILVAFAFMRWLSVPIVILLVAAAVGNIAGQIGDLLESAYKRSAGVKDSGALFRSRRNARSHRRPYFGNPRSLVLFCFVVPAQLRPRRTFPRIALQWVCSTPTRRKETSESFSHSRFHRLHRPPMSFRGGGIASRSIRRVWASRRLEPRRTG